MSDRVLLIHRDQSVSWCSIAMDERGAATIHTGQRGKWPNATTIPWRRVADGVYAEDGAKPRTDVLSHAINRYQRERK